jgi:hypothetical protein
MAGSGLSYGFVIGYRETNPHIKMYAYGTHNTGNRCLIFRFPKPLLVSL